MTVLFTLITLTSILVLGWTIASQEGMVFHSVRKWAEEKQDNGYFMMKSFFTCHWCLPTIWSILAYLLVIEAGLIYPQYNHLFLYPFVVAGSSISCGLIWSLYEKIDAETNVARNEEQLTYFEIKNRKTAYNKQKVKHG